MHVQAHGNGRTRLYWEKSRWSSSLHQTSAVLTWSDNEGFNLEDKCELTDDTIADAILAAVRENSGLAWDPIEPR